MRTLLHVLARPKIIIYIFLLGVLSSTEILPLSPNTLSRFRAYIWNGTGYGSVNALADNEGERRPVTAHFVTNQLYFIYGIFPRVNLWLGFDFLVSSAPKIKTDVGLGYGRIGSKLTLLKQPEIPFGAALETSLKFPISDYDPEKVNAFGDGQTDIDLGLILGHRLSGFPMRFALGGGYRVRFEETPDQFYLAFEIGSKYFQAFGLKLKSYYYHSLEGLEYAGAEFSRLKQENGAPPFPRLTD